MEKNPKSIDTSPSRIKRLFFATPSIPFFKCREVFENFSSKTVEEKISLVEKLEKQNSLFKESITDIDDEFYQESCDDIKKHISSWESNFGKVTIQDIAFMLKSTDIKLVDVALDHVNPNALIAMLDEYIIGQPDYKKALGLVVHNHMLRQAYPDVKLHKINVLVAGPSGVGKTFGLKTLADNLNVAMAIVNCNSLVQEGIVGNSLSDALTTALGNDRSKTHVLIGLDEFDKLFEDGNYNKRILQELLNWLDNNNTVTFAETFLSQSARRTIPSNNITCVLCGKFDSLKNAVRKRLNLDSVGFCANTTPMTDDELYAQITNDDLREVLGSDELCGRINITAPVCNLTTEQLAEVLLKGKGSVYQDLKTYFALHDAEFILTKGAAETIAKYAHQHYQNLGVRALETVTHQVVMDEMLNVEQYRGKTIRKNIHDVKKMINTP